MSKVSTLLAPDSNSEDEATYRHVAHLWQNWLPPKAMATLEKGENNFYTTVDIYHLLGGL